jgi:hypothetical protein
MRVEEEIARRPRAVGGKDFLGIKTDFFCHREFKAWWNMASTV